MYNGLQCLHVKKIIVIYALGSANEKFDVWNEVAPHLNLGVDPKEMSDLIDSNVHLFMYLIEGIRFRTWNVRRLNRAEFNGEKCWDGHKCLSFIGGIQFTLDLNHNYDRILIRLYLKEVLLQSTPHTLRKCNQMRKWLDSTATDHNNDHLRPSHRLWWKKTYLPPNYPLLFRLSMQPMWPVVLHKFILKTILFCHVW